MSPMLGYLAIEALLLVLLRFTPANGVWMLLSGFLVIGFLGAFVFRKRPLQNSRALILSTGVVFLVFWVYIFATLISATMADPGIVPEAVREALRQNAAGNIAGAIPNVLGAMFTSWMICVLLAMAGNTFGTKLRRLIRL